jgi:hypothetical protein
LNFPDTVDSSHSYTLTASEQLAKYLSVPKLIRIDVQLDSASESVFPFSTGHINIFVPNLKALLILAAKWYFGRPEKDGELDFNHG